MAEKGQETFGRDLLLELAIAKGVNYDRETITSRTPTKKQVLLGLRNKGITDPNKLISEIQNLKKRIKLWILEQKAKDLGVFIEHQKNRTLKHAIHIYCKDSHALEDLSKYQKSEPKTKTIFYNSKTQLTLDNWLKKAEHIKKIVENSLSDSESDSIATLDKIIPLGDKIRCEIGIDYKRLMVERKGAQFPHRKGIYDAYPLKKMVATYDTKNNTIQVSSHPKKTPVLIKALSDALTGKEDNFEIRKPSAIQALNAFGDKKVQKHLEENQVKITEILLKRIRIRGNPSYLHIKGENLLDTINLLKESDVHIVGKNIADISKVTFEFNNKKYSIDYENPGEERTGDFSAEDEYKIKEILSGWGI